MEMTRELLSSLTGKNEHPLLSEVYSIVYVYKPPEGLLSGFQFWDPCFFSRTTQDLRNYSVVP